MSLFVFSVLLLCWSSWEQAFAMRRNSRVAPTVVPAVCSPPPINFTPLRVSITGGHVGSVATYRCMHPGYTLMGPSTRRCLRNGTWSGSAPTCIIKWCSPLITHTPLMRGTTKGRLVGSVATYRCMHPGYTLMGPSTRECLRNGTWSGSTPTCIRVVCQALTASPSVIRVNVSAITTAGAVASYDCVAGYTLVGSSTRTCQNNGSWSGSEPTCIRKCPTLVNTSTLIVTVTSHRMGLKASYQCVNDSYQLMGDSTRRCPFTRGQYWRVAPSCINPCEGLTNSPSCSLSSNETLFLCENRSFSPESLNRVCSDRRNWNTLNITCARKHQAQTSSSILTIPHPDRNIYVTHFCRPGYTLVGSSYLTCTSGLWRNDSLPLCKRNCQPLTNMSTLRVSMTEGYEGGMASYECVSSNYTLIGPSTRQCLRNGNWSGPDPSCINIHNGYSTISWTNFLDATQTNFTSTPQTFLSAAHWSAIVVGLVLFCCICNVSIFTIGYICALKYYKRIQKFSHSNSRDGADGAINMPHIFQSSSPSSSKHPSIVETDINVAYGMVRAPATQSQSNADMVDNVAYGCITRNE